MANIVYHYILAEQKQTVFDEILKWIRIYIEIMDNTDESVYDKGSVKKI